MDPTRSYPMRSNERTADFGQGSWRLAVRLTRWAREVAATRLGVDYIDLHLVRWRVSVHLVETVDGSDELGLDGYALVSDQYSRINEFEVKHPLVQDLWSLPVDQQLRFGPDRATFAALFCILGPKFGA